MAGVFTGTELKKLSLDGSPPVTLVRGLLNGMWGFGVSCDDDVLIYSTMEHLLQIPAAGGPPAALTTIDGAKGESFHHFPQLVPSTGDVLFTVEHNDGTSRIDLIRADTKERSAILESAASAVLTRSGHLLFSRDGALMAARFDARRVGSPVRRFLCRKPSSPTVPASTRLSSRSLRRERSRTCRRIRARRNRHSGG